MDSREAFRNYLKTGAKIGEPMEKTFNAGFLAGLASQAQQTESKPVVWGYAWQCKSMGDWRIEKLGEGCIPPKDTLALYVIPPAPEGE